MSRAALTDLLSAASARRGGVGSFNVILLEHAEAIVSGAQQAGAPVVLQISQNCVAYHGALAPIVRASIEVAAAASVPVAVHLDHADDVALVHEAVDLGVDSVMFDASKLGYDANVAATQEVVAHCHERRVAVEAELGEVGGKDGVHAPGVRTDPAEAAEFAAATGVDALAVAVGSSHAMVTRDAALDLELIERLRDAVPVPLVLHGSSGVPDAMITRAVEAGMTKINLSTHLNAVFTAALRDLLAEQPTVVDPREYVGAGRAALAGEAARLLEVLRAVP